MLLLLGRSALCNLVTVDDSDPSVLYSPVGAWTARSATENCTECTAQPDPSEMYNGTWHDGTFNPDAGSNDFPNTPLFANLTFYGTAVYVFCALAESKTSPDGDSVMGFYIDNELKDTFNKSALGLNDTYDYNVPVFSISSLTLDFHELVLQNGIVNGSKSLVLLDYILYSNDSTEPSPSFTTVLNPTSSSNIAPSALVAAASTHDTPTIVAVAVIVPIGAFLLILCTIYLRRRWRRRRQTEMTTSQPRASPFTLPSHILPQKLNCPWKPSTVVPVPAPALSSWTIEPLSLPPSHPASGYVNGSGRPVTASVPSAPPSSQQAQGDIVEPPRRISYPNPASQSTSSRLSRYPTSPSSASSSSYGVVIYVHNLQDP
ncbi:hypothetical protein BT96DRAFT_992938 [Gymnopus androsaceus JB14]|uniref:Uncharacterized protein n=1 Tax=Gymnopus androsaceus JB14 TaxID=1447944 RepID=A0A6A4HU19_9AGAR|nr:hypothetical protein BT96DRAFT_992938 [Gymnopus androsaceus JB14]